MDDLIGGLKTWLAAGDLGDGSLKEWLAKEWLEGMVGKEYFAFQTAHNTYFLQCQIVET